MAAASADQVFAPGRWGPFELLEARRAIEGETCAMAAARITDEQLKDLQALVEEMQSENAHSVLRIEDADRRFCELIPSATQNSAMIDAVTSLWDARMRSPQNCAMSNKVHAMGVKPRIDEHTAIIKALTKRDPQAARQAMRDHLTGVMEDGFKATEVEELERAVRRSKNAANATRSSSNRCSPKARIELRSCN